MPVGRPPRRHCRGCNIEVEHRSELSKRGLCGDCGVRIQVEALTQIAAHNGPYFERWRMRTLAAFGGVPLDGKRDSA